MATSGTDRIRFLLELGEADQRGAWPDYLNYGLTEPDGDDMLELLSYYLMQYGYDNSILDVSELDGFFAALACAPETILPSRWMPVIWGGENQSPAW